MIHGKILTNGMFKMR